MRALPLVLVLAVSGCAMPPAAEAIDATELCRRLVALRPIASACCAGDAESDELIGVFDACTSRLAPLLDDPRVGVDAQGASAFVDEFERRLRACDPDTLAFVTGASGTRTVFAGTRGIGAECTPETVTDAAAFLSCRGGYCPFVSAGQTFCAPYAVEGAGCASFYDCMPGLYCTADTGSTAGICRRPQAVGARCSTGIECASGYCATSACATPSRTHPETLCHHVPVATDRDVTLALDGFDSSATRTVTLRVLGATDAPLLVYEMDGTSSASASHTIPRAIPDGMAALAQVWTEDLSSPTPDRRTWEVPVPATGAIAVAIAFDAATTPLTRDPPPSFDELFEFQLFDFDPELRKTFNLRVENATTHRTLGQLRVAAVPDIGFTVRLPGAVTPGANHRISMYVDQNDDDAYEPPPVDHAWAVFAMAPPTGGLSLPWSWSSAYQDVAF